MRRLAWIIVCLIIIIPSCGIVSQGVAVLDITGTWKGEVESETGDIERGVMEITKIPDGLHTGRLISSDRGALDIKVDVIRLQGNIIHFEIPTINGVFDGTVNDKGKTIRGEWFIDDMKFKVLMKKEQ